MWHWMCGSDMKNDPDEASGGKPCAELELLTPKEAARFLKLSDSFLAKARMRGDGPRYRKLSRAVRYTTADLLLWLKACAKTSTAEGQHERIASTHRNEEEW
jgi:hypothetical protein